MTTIIERPSGGSDGSIALIALVGAVTVAGVIGMFAYGVFDRPPTEMNLTIEAPAAAVAPPAPTAPQAAPAEAPPAPEPMLQTEPAPPAN